MADRPQHIHRAIEALRFVTSSSPIATGDMQQVTGYVARLERKIEALEAAREPSLWRRIQRRLSSLAPRRS